MSEGTVTVSVFIGHPANGTYRARRLVNGTVEWLPPGYEKYVVASVNLASTFEPGDERQ